MRVGMIGSSGSEAMAQMVSVRIAGDIPVTASRVVAGLESTVPGAGGWAGAAEGFAALAGVLTGSFFLDDAIALRGCSVGQFMLWLGCVPQGVPGTGRHWRDCPGGAAGGGRAGDNP